MLHKLRGTPMLLLKDFCEKYVLSYSLNVLPSSVLSVVLPELPVIAITFRLILFLFRIANLFKKLIVLGHLINLFLSNLFIFFCTTQ